MRKKMRNSHTTFVSHCYKPITKTIVGVTVREIKLTSATSSGLHLKRTPLLVIHNTTTYSTSTTQNTKYTNNKHHFFFSLNALSPSLSICTLVTVPERDIEHNTTLSCQFCHLLVNVQTTWKPNKITRPSIGYFTNLHAHF
jgi:hypothetical protein